MRICNKPTEKGDNLKGDSKSQFSQIKKSRNFRNMSQNYPLFPNPSSLHPSFVTPYLFGFSVPWAPYADEKQSGIFFDSLEKSMIDGTFAFVFCKIPFSQRPKCLYGLCGITVKMVLVALMLRWSLRP